MPAFLGMGETGGTERQNALSSHKVSHWQTAARSQGPSIPSWAIRSHFWDIPGCVSPSVWSVRFRAANRWLARFRRRRAAIATRTMSGQMPPAQVVPGVRKPLPGAPTAKC
jgi:hypothetical protein